MKSRAREGHSGITRSPLTNLGCLLLSITRAKDLPERHVCTWFPFGWKGVTNGPSLPCINKGKERFLFIYLKQYKTEYVSIHCSRAGVGKWAKHGQLPGFVNKVLLGHCCAQTFACCLGWVSSYNDRVKKFWKKGHGLQILLFGPLIPRCADPCRV